MINFERITREMTDLIECLNAAESYNAVSHHAFNRLDNYVRQMNDCRGVPFALLKKGAQALDRFTSMRRMNAYTKPTLSLI